MFNIRKNTPAILLEKNIFPREAVKIPLLKAFEKRWDDILKIILQGINCALLQRVNSNSHKNHKMVFCGYDSGYPVSSCFIESFAATNMNFSRLN